MNILIKTIKRAVLLLIKAYQRTLSPDHGLFAHRHPYGFCRFRPTCSEYTYQSIEQFGVIKGSWLGVKRIIRCNPFNQGGYDPIKQNDR